LGVTTTIDLVPPEVIRPLKRSEYLRLAELDAFADERVELLYGRIVRMSPQKERHAFSVTRFANLLLPSLVGRATVRVQMPFLAPGESVPEPDIAVVPVGDYLDAHPSEAFLVVEVADSSLSIDRAKARLYAEARVTEYWLIDVTLGIVERSIDPGPDGYGRTVRHARGDSLRVPTFRDVVVQVDEVVPPKR
jgi:Uma2 family endonuclease